MTTEALLATTDDAWIERDLLVQTYLVNACIEHPAAALQSPPLRLTHPSKPHSAIVVVDAQLRMLKVVFARQAIEVWCSKGLESPRLVQSLMKKIPSEEIHRQIWARLLEHMS